MKNTQKTPPSVANRIFSAVSAVSIVALTGYAFANGAIFFGAEVFIMGFIIRLGILAIADKDRELKDQQAQDENDKFFY